MPEVFNFSSCCGLLMATEFNTRSYLVEGGSIGFWEDYLPEECQYNGWSNQGRQPTKAEIKKAKAAHKKDADKEFLGQFKDLQGNNLSTVLVLEGAQNKECGPELRKLGYKVIKKFYNPKHRSLLYMYFKDEFPEKNPTHKDFKKNYKVVKTDDGYETVTKK